MNHVIGFDRHFCPLCLFSNKLDRIERRDAMIFHQTLFFIKSDALMPSLYYRVDSPGVNILKTVTDEVVSGLLNELDLARYFKDSVYIMSSFMANSQYSTDGRPDLIKNRCDIDVSYIMNKTQVPWPVDTPYTTTAYGLRSTHKGNKTPILIDVESDILIEQHSVACALDMNFVLTFNNFDEATRAFDTIKTRYEGTLTQIPFDIAFSYPVSLDLLTFLTAVYKAKTNYQNKTLYDYIQDKSVSSINFDVRKSQLTQSNADYALMIRQQQLRCLYLLTMDQKEPEVSRIDELPDGYTLSFNLQFQFGRPTLLLVHTPVSVDNSLLPTSLFSSVTKNYHNNPDVTALYESLFLDNFSRQNYGNKSAQDILRSPIYDDWFSVDPQYVFFKYRPFAILHFTLDGPQTIINLDNLGDIGLHPIVLKIIREMGNQVLNYGGIFNIGVYANNLRLGPEIVSLDDNLNLIINSERPDQVYHLMISETTNLFRMTRDWDDLLIKYRYFFPLTIARNIEHLVNKQYFNIVTDDSFLILLSKLKQSGKLYQILKTMISLEEDTNQIYGYAQNPNQLSSYLLSNMSQRKNYQIPTGTDDLSVTLQNFYQNYASLESRSLFIAFLEQLLRQNLITLETLPLQYLDPSKTTYPYFDNGAYYGFNTPFRILNAVIHPERSTE